MNSLPGAANQTRIKTKKTQSSLRVSAKWLAKSVSDGVAASRLRREAFRKSTSDQADAPRSPEFLEFAPRDELKEVILLVLRDVNR
jgi:hypothetical protein